MTTRSYPIERCPSEGKGQVLWTVRVVTGDASQSRDVLVVKSGFEHRARSWEGLNGRWTNLLVRSLEGIRPGDSLSQNGVCYRPSQNLESARDFDLPGSIRRARSWQPRGGGDDPHAGFDFEAWSGISSRASKPHDRCYSTDWRGRPPSGLDGGH